MFKSVLHAHSHTFGPTIMIVAITAHEGFRTNHLRVQWPRLLLEACPQ
jgi:hypothetical protein